MNTALDPAPQSLEAVGYQLTAARALLDQAMKTARTSAVEAYARGTNQTKIAKALGVTQMTVWRWLRDDRT